MPHELDKILISSSHPTFGDMLSKLRFSVVHATRFRIDSPENEQLKDIVKDVMKRGDKAVAEYTEKLDDVKLTPEQFDISNDELERAHGEINEDLLASLRKAIENVRKYQKEI
ncbi:MAG: histidinol dehydrogenase, partial [Planctomycetota bacterium]